MSVPIASSCASTFLAPSIEGANNVIEQLLAIGTDIGSRNVNDYLDLGVIELLKQEGYFDQLAKAYPVKQ